MGDKRESITFEDSVAAPVATPEEEETAASTSETLVSWMQFIRDSSFDDIRERFAQEVAELLATNKTIADDYCCLTLFDPKGSIGTFEADRIYHALEERNSDRSKDVLLLVCSPGGNIEPAYQVTKVCKRYSSNRFVCAIPRQAKSAATLIAIGADEIHMGPLGELGPIDPQIGGLPALGVKQALETIAILSEQHPGSSQMFAEYLRVALTVEQIGYCERISESAVQYAERLLTGKEGLPETPAEIAHELVHEYKHHGFVIDVEEAETRFGKSVIRTGTPEAALSEEFYDLFAIVDLWLVARGHYLVAEGIMGEEPMILKPPRV